MSGLPLNTRAINAAIRANEQGRGQPVYAVVAGIKHRVYQAKTSTGVANVRRLSDGQWIIPESVVQE